MSNPPRFDTLLNGGQELKANERIYPVVAKRYVAGSRRGAIGKQPSTSYREGRQDCRSQGPCDGRPTAFCGKTSRTRPERSETPLGSRCQRNRGSGRHRVEVDRGWGIFAASRRFVGALSASSSFPADAPDQPPYPTEKRTDNRLVMYTTKVAARAADSKKRRCDAVFWYQTELVAHIWWRRRPSNCAKSAQSVAIFDCGNRIDTVRSTVEISSITCHC